MRIRLVFPVVVALAVGLGGVAQAAHLEKKDEKIVKNTNPPEGGAPGTFPEDKCRADATGFYSVSFQPDQRSSSFTQDVVTKVSGSEPDCDVSAHGDITIITIFTLVPDPSDSEGDATRLCYRASFDQSAQSSQGYTAASAAGINVPVDDAAQIVVNYGEPDVNTVLSYGPTNVTAGPESKQFSGTFVAKIGDEIAMFLTTTADAAGAGIGSADARTQGSMAVGLGACPAPAPAVSGSWLGALGLLLPALGWVLLRRRADTVA